MEKFVIAKDSVSNIRRFNLRGRKLEFRLRDIPANESDPAKWFKSGIEDIVRYATKDLEPKDKVGITFCGKGFERGPGWMDFKNAGDVTMEDVWGLISKIYQSNSQGISTDTFCLGVTSVRLPRGTGRGNKYNAFNEESAKRRGIITINNKDNLCLPRAIVVGQAHADKDIEYPKVRKDVNKVQTKRALDLLKKSGVNIPPEGGGIPELQQLQTYLTGYKLCVYRYGEKGRDVIYEGGNESPKKINLLYHGNHYNVITSLTSAFCCGYYCEDCHTGYNTKSRHRCGETCPCCQQSPVCPFEGDIDCEKCNRRFRGHFCFENHLTQNICDQVKKCLECLKTYRNNRTHVCGEIFCNICHKHCPQGHLCYIQPDHRKPPTKDILFIFYDLETRQEMTNEKNESVHEPNLCVFQKRCSNCIDEVHLVFCQKCGFRQTILHTGNIIETFLTTILTLRKKFNKIVVIAHNGQAFDHQFVLKYIFENTSLKPELIMRGTKIILMQLNNVKFLDSLNYFPMALSKLPKAFDLPSTFKKGYFPHLFNTEDNQHYIGPIPDMKFYSPNSMMKQERADFVKWYELQKDSVFDFQKEFVGYCVSDVEILTQACLKFRQIMLQECNVDPFMEATTIAAACNLIFRRNFLKPNTIGIIPKNGYRLAENQSISALQWLLWESDIGKINILHTGNGKEAILNGVKVDGFCPETNQVFEFHGCYYHGHTCITHNRDSPLHDDPTDTINHRYEATKAKVERLRSFGYEVIEKWECDFRQELLTNEKMQYLESHPVLLKSPLNPRDAFYGGRTGNTYKYYRCKSGEKIKYVDVCSLYPWVCKNGKFPVGHPKLHIGHEDCSSLNLKETNGLIKCSILPPQDLYHPVIPLKMNDKLMFVLCRTCGETMNQNSCNHSDVERTLNGTWVIDEVNKAVDKGYEIKQIHEIWSYDIEQFDKLLSTPGLFTGMMNTFLKMKTQASGWPANCITQEQREAYIEDFLNNEDVRLEFSKICNNPGLRSLAKLILNSFWGKFGQRENQTKTSIIREPFELFELLSNPSINVCHIYLVNEEVLIVCWQYKEEAADCLSTVNVCIAAYTTVQARLKLYSYLEKLEDRVLYYDTDSIIYISREGEYDVPTGEFVGDMTDELESYGFGSYITEFCSGGPKTYAYAVLNPITGTSTTVCKVKGIRLNFTTSDTINFESMKEMILKIEEEEDEMPLSTTTTIPVITQKIRRTASHGVITREESKEFRITSNKRKFTQMHDSLPYGHKRICKKDSLSPPPPQV